MFQFLLTTTLVSTAGKFVCINCGIINELTALEFYEWGQIKGTQEVSQKIVYLTNYIIRKCKIFVKYLNIIVRCDLHFRRYRHFFVVTLLFKF